MVLFSRRMHFTQSPAPRARKDAVLAVLSLWLSGTVGWGQELTWLLHKVSFISTHVTWPVATPPPAAILSALPSKAGLGQVVWGIGRGKPRLCLEWLCCLPGGTWWSQILWPAGFFFFSPGCHGLLCAFPWLWMWGWKRALWPSKGVRKSSGWATLGV